MQYGEQAGTGTRQAPRQVQEPILTYDQQTGRWSGANAQFSVWMDDAAFREYVASWYGWPKWLPDCPPAERRAASIAHCQRVRYWLDCERNYDCRVHITYY